MSDGEVPRPLGAAVESDDEARDHLRRAHQYLVREPARTWLQVLYQGQLRRIRELEAQLGRSRM